LKTLDFAINDTEESGLEIFLIMDIFKKYNNFF